MDPKRVIICIFINVTKFIFWAVDQQVVSKSVSNFINTIFKDARIMLTVFAADPKHISQNNQQIIQMVVYFHSLWITYASRYY